MRPAAAAAAARENGFCPAIVLLSLCSAAESMVRARCWPMHALFERGRRRRRRRAVFSAAALRAAKFSLQVSNARAGLLFIASSATGSRAHFPFSRGLE